LELDPDLHIARYFLGRVYFENGQYIEAEETFKKFLRVVPYFPDAHNLLAIVHAAQRQFDRAVAEFEWEIRINPFHAMAHQNLGNIYWYEFQNRQKAIYHLKAALMLDPFLPNRKGIQSLVRTLEGLP
jgi:tetratricopeptide (TPR) repeat protein